MSEPVQVYLSPAEYARLDRLVARLDSTKSGVVRQALVALERETTTPAAHPAMQLVGIADDAPMPPVDYDIAREHDRYLAESEAASWSAKAKKRGR